jgi:TRAP-type C4-dicarboxylate transport system permease small subunit
VSGSDVPAHRGAASAQGAAGRAVLRLDLAGAVVAGVGVLVMMLIGAFDVVATHFLGRPIPGAFEITEAMMVASIFLAAAMAQRERKHIRVEILVDRLRPRARAILDLVAHLVTLGVFALITWYAWAAAAKSLAIGEFSAGLIRFPVWPAKLALAIGAAMMVMQSIADSAREIRALWR